MRIVRIKGRASRPSVAPTASQTSYIHFTLQHKPGTANLQIRTPSDWCRPALLLITLPGRAGSGRARSQNGEWDEVREFEFRATECHLVPWLGNQRGLLGQASGSEFSRVHCLRGGPRHTECACYDGGADSWRVHRRLLTRGRGGPWHTECACYNRGVDSWRVHGSLWLSGCTSPPSFWSW